MKVTEETRKRRGLFVGDLYNKYNEWFKNTDQYRFTTKNCEYIYENNNLYMIIIEGGYKYLIMENINFDSARELLEEK